MECGLPFLFRDEAGRRCSRARAAIWPNPEKALALSPFSITDPQRFVASPPKRRKEEARRSETLGAEALRALIAESALVNIPGERSFSTKRALESPESSADCSPAFLASHTFVCHWGNLLFGLREVIALRSREFLGYQAIAAFRSISRA